MLHALPPELPRVSAGGVSAYADALALGEHETYGRDQLEIWFLSLLGPQQSVKSLWANLLKGQLVTLAWDEAQRTELARLAPLGKEGWRRWLLALPAASAHQLALVPKPALWTGEEPSFLLLPRRPEEAARTHYRRLNPLTDVPLAANWADWLWSRALQRREAIPLASRGVTAYRCRPDLARLTADVCEGVAVGVLTVPAGAACTDGAACLERASGWEAARPQPPPNAPIAAGQLGGRAAADAQPAADGAPR